MGVSEIVNYLVIPILGFVFDQLRKGNKIKKEQMEESLLEKYIEIGVLSAEEMARNKTLKKPKLEHALDIVKKRYKGEINRGIFMSIIKSKDKYKGRFDDDMLIPMINSRINKITKPRSRAKSKDVS